MCMLKSKLDQFSLTSGLAINPLKSNIFLTGISPQLRVDILSAIGFHEGVLPIKYLGGPLMITVKSSLGKLKLEHGVHISYHMLADWSWLS